MDWQAIIVTAKLAFWTTAILFVVGLPIAYWTARSRWRLKFLVDALIAMPIILPPTVVGFYLLVAMGSFSPAGRLFRSFTGNSFAFSFTGILIASIIYNLPFTIRPFAAAFAAVDRRLIEAAWCLGESRLGTFRRVILPLSWAGVLSGMVLTFAHTVGEFGLVWMIGGNRPGITRTASVAIYDQMQSMDYATANHTSLLLIGFSFITLCITYGLQRRVLP